MKRERDAAVAAERAASDEAMRLADEGHEAAVGSLKAAFTSELAAAREHSAQLETKLADLEVHRLAMWQLLDHLSSLSAPPLHFRRNYAFGS